MNEITNLTQEDVLELIEDFPIIPRRNKVIITLNSEEIDGNLLLSNTGFSETQYVLAKGSHVTDIEPGQKIVLDVEKMMEYVDSDENAYEKVGRIKIKPIHVGEKVYGLINDNVIDALDFRE